MTVDGKLKLIDFGAAVDMCTGINFNPEAGMLDPRCELQILQHLACPVVTTRTSRSYGPLRHTATMTRCAQSSRSRHCYSAGASVTCGACPRNALDACQHGRLGPSRSSQFKSLYASLGLVLVAISCANIC